MNNPANQTTQRIADLNDQCRKRCMIPVFGATVPCKYILTSGIVALSPVAQICIAAKVRDFNEFTPDNDPYGEHDFGSIEHDGQKIFWKFDYYDMTLQYGSEDPADPEQTMRVLTIMLAEEY